MIVDKECELNIMGKVFNKDIIFLIIIQLLAWGTVIYASIQKELFVVFLGLMAIMLTGMFFGYFKAEDIE
jgi:FtsH-binding integral membrane protein